MGTVGAVGALALGRCTEATSRDKVFGTAEQCAPQHGEMQCRQAHAHAVGIFPTVAPNFTALVACAGQFGEANCEPFGGAPVATAQFFVPRMVGFTMGNDAYGQPGLPVWVDAAGRIYVGGAPPASTGSSGSSSSSRSFFRSSSRSSSSSSSSSSSVSRGGFGSTGSSSAG